MSIVVDVGKAVIFWNSDTNAGRAALCWKLNFDVETIVNLTQRFSSRSRTEKSHGRTVLLQSEKCQNIFLYALFPKERRFCWENLGFVFCLTVKSTVEDESEERGEFVT